MASTLGARHDGRCIVPTRVGVDLPGPSGIAGISRLVIVPTRVGVDRELTDRHGWTQKLSSSPRAWGWTAEARVQFNDLGLEDIVPTRVGVDRLAPPWNRGMASKPIVPTRVGVDPSGTAGDSWSLSTTSSPRAWGWTHHARPRRSRRLGGIVPTRVGVDLIQCVAGAPDEGWSIVPTRVGVDPKGSERGRRSSGLTSSPRAWGWTDRHRSGGQRVPARVIVPTRVGVDRAVQLRAKRYEGTIVPTRVGVDRAASPDEASTSIVPSSPRAWGWTGAAEAHTQGIGPCQIVPTRVGVDLTLE